MNNVLRAREERAIQIEQLLERYEAIVCIKANIPGPKKQTPEAVFLVRFFIKQVMKFATSLLGYFQSEDGPYALFSAKSDDYFRLKKNFILIEESSTFGRLIDIDLYQKHTEYHRDQPRRCLICNDAAIVCQRNQKHTVLELENAFHNLFLTEYHDWLSGIVSQCILDELNLSPKFGLVSPFSSGSHPDMNYSLMCRAKDAMLPFFSETGLRAIHDYYIQKPNRTHIHAIGLEAEEAMFLATGGVNAYKGLIFNLGYVVYSLMGVLMNGSEWISVFEYISYLSHDLTAAISGDPKTFGEKVLIEYGFGARQAMQEGLVPVQRLFQQKHLNIEEQKLDALVYLMGEVDDTTLLKRCGSLSAYYKVKDRVRKLQKSDYEDFSNECVSLGLTFGGSADLLIVSLFIYRMRKSLFLDK